MPFASAVGSFTVVFDVMFTLSTPSLTARAFLLVTRPVTDTEIGNVELAESCPVDIPLEKGTVMSRDTFGIGPWNWPSNHWSRAGGRQPVARGRSRGDRA